jgi:hypothetical protein
MWTVPLLLATLAVGGAAPPPQPAEVCAELDRAIEDNLRNIADHRESIENDDNASRRSEHLLGVHDEILLISIHLELRRENGCPPRTEPIDTSRYMEAARECPNALRGWSIKKNGPPPVLESCIKSSWKPVEHPPLNSPRRQQARPGDAN